MSADCGRIPAMNATLLENNCQARVDPFFEFDQASFDAVMGSGTPPLEDFFEIDLSENILLALPEPGAGRDEPMGARPADPAALEIGAKRGCPGRDVVLPSSSLLGDREPPARRPRMLHRGAGTK